MIPNIKRGKITIFEGPDGSGKTYAAEEFAAKTKARLIHFNNLPNMHSGVARVYAEGMLPALLGYQDVVFDRCWISEVPYGRVYRNGQDRVGKIRVRMLERLALSCGAVVVLCLPEVDKVLEVFKTRREIEYLDSEQQLRDVHSEYALTKSGLPVLLRDYTVGLCPTELDMNLVRTQNHDTAWKSAGNLNARVVLVLDKFGPHSDCDLHYQWPMGNLDLGGTTKILMDNGIREQDILWLHVDDLKDHDIRMNIGTSGKHVIGLDRPSADRLKSLGFGCHFLPSWSDQFGPTIKEMLHV